HCRSAAPYGAWYPFAYPDFCNACWWLLLGGLLGRVVGRVHVRDAPGPDAVQLDDGLALRHSVVVHALRDRVEAAVGHFLERRLVELVTHAHPECALNNGDMLFGGMKVRRNLPAVGDAQADG